MKISTMLIWAMLVLATSPNFAYGYIDPGAGTLITQLLYSLGVGLLFYLVAAMGFLRKQLLRFKNRPLNRDSRAEKS